MFTQFIAGWILLMVGCVAAHAEQLPDYYPRNYHLGGTLEAINRDDLMLTISDIQVRVSSNTRVHTLREKNTYLGALKVGQHVGVHFANPGSDKPTVNDVWVLESAQQLIPPPPGMH